jgi:2-amino-4-hydroxy-6-hydroxymethyldihydropteridine diphosphokinase
LPSRPERGKIRRERVYVALGSNLGDRNAHLRSAREALASLPDSSLIAASAIEETAPLGGMEQPPYLNQMVLLETGLEPRALLHALHGIELRQGRERTERWGPRTLDLDIVRYGNRQVTEPDLIIPHPELPNRDFWRRELAEIESR